MALTCCGLRWLTPHDLHDAEASGNRCPVADGKPSNHLGLSGKARQPYDAVKCICARTKDIIYIYIHMYILYEISYDLSLLLPRVPSLTLRPSGWPQSWCSARPRSHTHSLAVVGPIPSREPAGETVRTRSPTQPKPGGSGHEEAPSSTGEDLNNRVPPSLHVAA